MSKINTFEYKEESFNKIRDFKYGSNWPIVYIIEDGNEAYIGETINAYNRSKEHYKINTRKKLKKIHIIGDNEFNKSATLDIESSLIEYMSADGKFLLQNGNMGLSNHNYFDREKYKSKFEVLWDKLQKINLAKNSLLHIQNSNIFKYSPYKSLSQDQESTVNSLFSIIYLLNENGSTNMVLGGPGTGKTILAIYLIKLLQLKEETKNLKVGLVIPMTSLRKTIRKVFKCVKGLKVNMVIGPSDVVKDMYDVLIIDEAHRLKRRINITNRKSFDDINKKLGFQKDKGTELDWILNSARHHIFFYDKDQSVKPSDVPSIRFNELDEKVGVSKFYLTSQMRVKGGEDYINYIDNILNFKQKKRIEFENYQLKIYGNIKNMVFDIKKLDKAYGLCRIVSGIAWEWKTKKKESLYDFQIEDLNFIWNSTNEDWVNSENAINEVGCIHTVQGYDLNYVGVIIGPEITYDKDNNKFVIHKEMYADRYGKQTINDDEQLENYIKNIYKTLLTRGIQGTYIYIVDEGLRNYFSRFIHLDTN